MPNIIYIIHFIRRFLSKILLAISKLQNNSASLSKSKQPIDNIYTGISEEPLLKVVNH